jgi:hypothetical protein
VVIPPGMTRGRPAGRPTSRPTFAPASAADQPQALGASSAASVKAAGRRRQYPLADASRYEPINGRGRDALSIRCSFCKGIHLGRVRPRTEPGGPTRTPCGMVCVVVRRTYRPKADAISEAAA